MDSETHLLDSCQLSHSHSQSCNVCHSEQCDLNVLAILSLSLSVCMYMHVVYIAIMLLCVYVYVPLYIYIYIYNSLTQHPLNTINLFNAQLTLGIKKAKGNAHCLIYGHRWHL